MHRRHRIPVVIAAFAWAVTSCAQPHELILASTTSTVDSGLLDVLVPAFERAHGDIRIKVIGVGSGEAMALGRRRDADILLVHSPADEAAFMADGNGERRLPVMENDFIIAGPPDDLAGIRDEETVVGALRRIAAGNAPFISRGDASGTYRKEMSLWAAAGVMADTRMEVGQGMGEALAIASERTAYVLSDRGTYLALSGNLRLDVLSEGDAMLANPYSVIKVRDSRNAAYADAFVDWLVSEDAAALIRNFGRDRFGEPLFFPVADLDRS